MQNRRVRLSTGFASLLVASSLAVAAAPPSPARKPAAIGLAVNLPPESSAGERQKALDEVRATGASVFALAISWPAAEPRPRKYDVADVTRAARLLRQSGATLHLDLPLVDGRGRQVPADLAAVPFDDPKLAARLGRLLEALGPALLDFSTLSLGNEADSYFASRPEELTAYVRLFGGAVEFLGKAAPRLLVGVATAAPMDSRAPGVAARLHEKSPAVFFVYAPFVAAAPFTHRPPAALESDWKAMLVAAAGRPVALTEVSFSSSPENGSSPAKQADFVRRMRKFVLSADPARLLFARYVPWRDPAPRETPAAGEASADARRREAFFANRGLQRSNGTAKPAWREWSRSAPPATARP
ncbi:MAG TPA: hypothetical protein VFF17_00550 [Thermoanaerobaculia bacterium]|nr:hypothetical protein [Thermoanaerobaculia bacterium]